MAYVIENGVQIEVPDDFITPVVVNPVVESVSARQFKLQLLAQDLLDDADAWVATQDRATQISYEYATIFVKSDPMMQAAFNEMGFTEQQVDDFYTAASAL